MVKRVIDRAKSYLRRSRNARAIGLSFHNSRDFSVPSHLSINGQERNLDIPEDHGSRIAFIDIFLDDCYGLRELPGDIDGVLDIGAHVGLFSTAARQRFPRARIHAYEPNPEVHRFLSHQARIASFDVFPRAVGVVSARVSLRGGEDSVHTKVVRDTSSNIECVSFADAITKVSGRSVLAKLDCEGSEWEILDDVRSWQGVKYLTMEYHLWAGYTLAGLKSKITALGFAIKPMQELGGEFGILIAQRN